MSERQHLFGGISTIEAAANITANLGRCQHVTAIPVDLVVTGERVGYLCGDCLISLPMWWPDRYAD